MSSLLSGLLWAARTVLGLGIAICAAILAYESLYSLRMSFAGLASAFLPAWSYLHLGPAMLLTFIAALFIRVRLWTLAIGILMASLLTLVFGAPQHESEELALISDGVRSITGQTLWRIDALIF